MGHQTFLQVDFSQWETLAIIFTRIAVYLPLDSLYRAVKGVNCYLETWRKSFYKIDSLTDSDSESLVNNCYENWATSNNDIFIQNLDEEQRFMYKINQGHLTIFCIVFVWLGGPPSPVRIMTQVLWFMYQNRLGPSGGIYYLNFVPCFVVLYLN